MAQSKKTFHIEQGLKELEQLVKHMESGELTLEESLSTFEQGVKLTKACQQALGDAERKIKILMQTHAQDKATAIDFDPKPDQIAN